MKTKSLLIVLLVIGLLFLYSSFCYAFANHTIEIGSREVITNYLNTMYNDEVEYEYIKAINNEDNTLSIYIKIHQNNKEEYYKINLVRNGNVYNIIGISNDVPSYIK